MTRKTRPNDNGEKVLCPCFRATGKCEIWCESHVPESNQVVIKYRNAEAQKKQIKLYCECNYKRCEHYLSVKHMKWED